MDQPENTDRQTEAATKSSSPEPGVDAFGDFLAFRRFATPALVQIVFWIGTLIFLIWGGSTISDATSRYRTDEAMVWTGIAIMVLGPTMLRIAGELILVVFRIHDQVGRIAKAGN